LASLNPGYCNTFSQLQNSTPPTHNNKAGCTRARESGQPLDANHSHSSLAVGSRVEMKCTHEGPLCQFGARIQRLQTWFAFTCIGGLR